MPDAFTIENATWRDLNGVWRLEKICFPKDMWPIWDIIGVLTFSNVIRLKAVSTGQIVGFVAGDIRRSQNLSWIATIGVLPEFRRRGMGRALLVACEERLPTPAVRLCVRASNEEALTMYQDSGYARQEVWDRYYLDGEAAIVMEKLRRGGL